MITSRPELVHATAISVGGCAALITGSSGAGKSDLALRALTTPFVIGGKSIASELVADDQVVIERNGDELFASPPPTIAGKLEVRGIGIVPFPYRARAVVRLFVDLAPVASIERLPSDDDRRMLLGIAVPVVRLDAREPGAPARLMLALLRVATN